MGSSAIMTLTMSGGFFLLVEGATSLCIRKILTNKCMLHVYVISFTKYWTTHSKQTANLQEGECQSLFKHCNKICQLYCW